MSLFKAYIVSNQGKLQLVDSNIRPSYTNIETVYKNPNDEQRLERNSQLEVLEQFEISDKVANTQYIATVQGTYGYCLQTLDKICKGNLPVGNIPTVVC